MAKQITSPDSRHSLRGNARGVGRGPALALSSVPAAPAAVPVDRWRLRASVIRTLLHDPVALTGAVIVAIVVGCAALAPFVAPFPPGESHPQDVLQGPTVRYALGTDELGRDILSRIIYGARISLEVSLGSVLVATPIGVLIGLLAGYAGGWIDNVISRILDIGFAFPALLLALLIVAVLGTELRNLVLALAVLNMPRFARVTRASVLSAKIELYVEAARSYGCSGLRITMRHILPNILSPIIVQATVTLASAVLAEASLSFLGLGVQPPEAAWGSMLNAGKIYMEQHPHVTIFPGLAIVVTVIGFNLLGDGLRDSFDPRLRRA